MTSILETFGRNHYQFLVRRIALNCRTSLTVLVYKKILKLSKSSFESTSVGQVLNILANDLNRFDELGHVMVYIVIAPIQSLIVLYIMSQYLGLACIGGMVILFLFIPLQGLMGRFFNQFRRKTTLITDERIKLMGEVISAMKLIKLYCWERPFSNLIYSIRQREIHMMKWSCTLKGINSALFFVATRIMLYASFVVYIFMGQPLTAETVFVSMALFNAIRLPVTNQFPNAIGLGAESLVACKRIEKILLQAEKSPNNLSKYNSKNGQVKLDNFSGKWSRSLTHETLKNISLDIKPGELIVVIGPVGSGKTCLLQAVLNEIESTGGTVDCVGKTSYAPQEAWCFTGTIKDNVTLGGEFDSKKYDRVIEACCLDRDLKLLPDGDKTQVGEKGFALSGGQKARVSLARAVYFDADVYLLDDPLSAVDPHVANHIFKHCIDTYLKKKTVILVTHQRQFIDKADKIVLIKDGSVVVTGTYDELITSNIDVFAHLNEELQAKKKQKERKESTAYLDSDSGRGSSVPGSKTPDESGDELSTNVNVPLRTSLRRRSSRRRSMEFGGKRYRLRTGSRVSITSLSSMNVEEDFADELTVDCKVDLAKGRVATSDNVSGASVESDDDDDDDESMLASSEQRTAGSIKLSTYWKYIRAGANIPFVISLIVAILIPQILYHYTDFWLSNWTKDYESFEVGHMPGDVSNVTTKITREKEISNVITYTSLMAALFAAAFFRVMCLYLLCLRCSRQLHNRIFSKLLRSPMLFFETNPVGRILNRFTRDIGQIDQKVPATLDEVIATNCNIVGILITSAIVSPFLLIPAAILIILAVPFRSVYLRTARDVQRLDAIARSPVYSHIAATFDGLTAIRAFNLQKLFNSQYYSYVNDSTSVRFLVLSTGRAYSFCLDVFALIYICAVCIFLMALPDGIPGGYVGLVLSSILNLIGLFQSAVRKTADFETQMVSCERVIEYGNLPQEAPLTNFTREDGKEDDFRPRSGCFSCCFRKKDKKEKRPLQSTLSNVKKDVMNMSQDEMPYEQVIRRKIKVWPTDGCITFRKIVVSYSTDESKPVLKGVSFVLKGGEKVGVVGRTGAGKSSMISVLFRLIEPSSGDVIIDNIDTQLLGLHELRSKISIIPQDPILFSGTVRSNLDPFNQYDDELLWSVLDNANLKSTVTTMGNGLESRLTEGGSNLSVGQRQLLCLARALLRQNKILVLDEATANVDMETDELIQKTIKTKFTNCTVITVAHRLQTIIEMDKVLVLDAGLVVEFEEPYILLSSGRKEHQAGYFASMCKETGPASHASLYAAAKKAFYERRAINKSN